MNIKYHDYYDKDKQHCTEFLIVYWIIVCNAHGSLKEHFSSLTFVKISSKKVKVVMLCNTFVFNIII
jgi:purine nucleoside phosphorylase